MTYNQSAIALGDHKFHRLIFVTHALQPRKLSDERDLLRKCAPTEKVVRRTEPFYSNAPPRKKKSSTCRSDNGVIFLSDGRAQVSTWFRIRTSTSQIILLTRPQRGVFIFVVIPRQSNSTESLGNKSASEETWSKRALRDERRVAGALSPRHASVLGENRHTTVSNG